MTFDLHDFTALIDRALKDDPAHLLLRVAGYGDDATLAVRVIGDDDPLDHLLGFTAPPDWLALGLRCTGRARRSSDPEGGRR
jgi:hypothetical protein